MNHVVPQIRTMSYLLENGADPNKTNNRGIAPKDLLE